MSAARGTAFGVWAVALGVYLLTLPTLGHNSDVYTTIVGIGSGDLTPLLSPHHLLYAPLGLVWTRILAALGLPLSTAVALRTLNALLGSLAVLGVYLLSGRLLADRTGRCLVAAGFAFCFAVWVFSVDVEVYVPSTAALVFSLLALEGAERGSRRSLIAAGFLYGLGTLFHQMGLLFGPAAAVRLYSDADDRRTFASRLGMFLATAAAVIVPPYLWAAWVVHGLRTVPELLTWLLGYSVRGYGSGLHLRGIADMVLGHGRSLVFFEFVLKDLQRRAPLVPLELALVAVTGLALLALTLGAALGWRRIGPGAPRGTVVALATWYLTFGLFTLWWEPENPEFWVTAMAPFWLLWASGVWRAGGRWRVLLAGLLVVMFACNLVDLWRRKDVASDPQAAAVKVMSQRLGPDDVILLPPDLDAKAAFFAPRLGRVGVYAVCKTTRDQPAEALAELERRVRREIQAGHRVFFYDRAFSREVLSPHPWCAEVEADFRRRFVLIHRFDVHLPVDEVKTDASRTVARWRPVPVFEVHSRE